MLFRANLQKQQQHLGTKQIRIANHTPYATRYTRLSMQPAWSVPCDTPKTPPKLRMGSSSSWPKGLQGELRQAAAAATATVPFLLLFCRLRCCCVCTYVVPLISGCCSGASRIEAFAGLNNILPLRERLVSHCEIIMRLWAGAWVL